MGVNMPFMRLNVRESCLRRLASSLSSGGPDLQHAEVVVLLVADAGRLVSQRPGGLEIDLHVGDHFGHGRQRSIGPPNCCRVWA